MSMDRTIFWASLYSYDKGFLSTGIWTQLANLVDLNYYIPLSVLTKRNATRIDKTDLNVIDQDAIGRPNSLSVQKACYYPKRLLFFYVTYASVFTSIRVRADSISSLSILQRLLEFSYFRQIKFLVERHGTGTRNRELGMTSDYSLFSLLRRTGTRIHLFIRTYETLLFRVLNRLVEISPSNPRSGVLFHKPGLRLTRARPNCRTIGYLERIWH